MEQRDGEKKAYHSNFPFFFYSLCAKIFLEKRGVRGVSEGSVGPVLSSPTAIPIESLSSERVKWRLCLIGNIALHLNCRCDGTGAFSGCRRLEGGWPSVVGLLLLLLLVRCGGGGQPASQRGKVLFLLPLRQRSEEGSVLTHSPEPATSSVECKEEEEEEEEEEVVGRVI